MGKRGRLIISIITSLGFYLLSAGGAYDSLQTRIIDSLDESRMTNVLVLSPEGQTRTQGAKAIALHAGVVTESALPSMRPVITENCDEESAPSETQIIATTIEGGMTIRNETDYFVDASELLKEGKPLTLRRDVPQILIIHTHSSEAYTQAGFDRYDASDSGRTEDTQFNVVRIGDELTDILSAAGLHVIHDRGIYDYPSYTGSYNRSGEAIQQYLKEYPSISIVIDLHRDALGTDGVVYKTMAEEDGVCSSQIGVVKKCAVGKSPKSENLQVFAFFRSGA